MISGMNERGSTLLEVLIAILVVAIGLIGMAGMLGYSLKGNQSSYLRTQAVILATDMGEAMRSQREQAENGDFDTGCSGQPDPGVSGTHDEKPCAYTGQWNNRVAEYLPSGTASISVEQGANSQYHASITINWDDSRGNVGVTGDTGQQQADNGNNIQSYVFEFDL